MKSLLLIAAVMLTSLGGCYIAPYGTHDDGYRTGREHREDGDHQRERDGHDDGRRGEHGDRDRYH